MLFNGKTINQIIEIQEKNVGEIEAYIILIKNAGPFTERDLEESKAVLSALEHLKTEIEKVHETSH
ncbi:MAG: hypothetical protein ACXWW0_00255 [Bacteroidia bacterium]